MSTRVYDNVALLTGRLMTDETAPHRAYVEKTGSRIDVGEFLKPFLGKNVSIIVMEET